MIKNRTAKLMFQTAFCTLGILGIIASFGTFNYTFRSDFYVHFTNLSNYLCIGVMFVELIETIKNKEDSYTTKLPLLKFIGLTAILLTFFIFNFMLAGDREPELNFYINSVLFHIVLPIMYVIDWVLFYEHKKVKWYYPLVSVSFPVIYAIFIFIRAWILDFNPKAPYIYPYFFLNLDELGILGVIKWIGILSVVFITIGYVIFGLDKILKKNKKTSSKKRK
jgi:hypothetical protein